MSEQHVFEIELRVRRHGQEDARIAREYHSKDAASTDKAAAELWAAVSDAAKARMTPVADGG